jgi:hypothetical protein
VHSGRNWILSPGDDQRIGAVRWRQAGAQLPAIPRSRPPTATRNGVAAQRELGVVRPLDGVPYRDDEFVLRERASRLEVAPNLALGLVVRVVGCPGAGRAVQLGCRLPGCGATMSPTTPLSAGPGTATPRTGN